MQRIGRLVLPFLLAAAVVGTAALTAVSLRADVQPREQQQELQETQQKPREDADKDQIIYAEKAEKAQSKVPIFAIVFGCTLLSSFVGAGTGIMSYRLQSFLEERRYHDKNKDEDAHKAKNRPIKKLPMKPAADTKHRSKDSRERDLEICQDIDLDLETINEEVRKKENKLEEYQDETVTEEWPDEDFDQEDEEPTSDLQLTALKQMSEFLYRDRKNSAETIKHMNGFNLNIQMIMEQIKRNDEGPVIGYLKESIDKKPLFLMDDGGYLWIHPVWTGMNERGCIEIKCTWYESASIKNVFEIRTKDGRTLTKTPSGRIEVAEIVPAEIAIEDDQYFVSKKGCIVQRT